MTSADRFRFGVALLILLLWGGAVIGVYGDQQAVNTITPIAFAAATFLFASPLFEARRDRKRKRADDD